MRCSDIYIACGRFKPTANCFFRTPYDRPQRAGLRLRLMESMRDGRSPKGFRSPGKAELLRESAAAGPEQLKSHSPAMVAVAADAGLAAPGWRRTGWIAQP